MNKQIEEMAFDMSASLVYFNGEPKIINWQETLENMHKKGYRRQEDVAREIFADIEKEIEPALERNYRAFEKYLNAQDSPTLLRVDGKIYAMRGIYCFIEELKKKYGVTPGKYRKQQP